MIIGFLSGIARMTLDFLYPAPACGEPDTRPLVLSKVHYMYFALILFVTTGLVCILVSLCTEPLDDEKVRY